MHLQRETIWYIGMSANELIDLQDGRDEMIAELEGIRLRLAKADDRIDPITDELCKKLGFTEDMLKQAAIDLLGEEMGAKVF